MVYVVSEKEESRESSSLSLLPRAVYDLLLRWMNVSGDEKLSEVLTRLCSSGDIAVVDLIFTTLFTESPLAHMRFGEKIESCITSIIHPNEMLISYRTNFSGSIYCLIFNEERQFFRLCDSEEMRKAEEIIGYSQSRKTERKTEKISVRIDL